MRLPSLALVLVLAASVAACGSTGGSSGGGGGGAYANAPAAKGNVQVVIRTWDPRTAQSNMTASLVNESSDAGRKLRSGRASSTVVRVLDDVQMGAILAALDKEGFATTARDGVTLDGLRPDAERRGVIIVERDGVSRGIDFVAGRDQGSLPSVYVECKRIILAAHASIPGYEARVSTGTEDDPSRVFQSPKAPPIRR